MRYFRTFVDSHDLSRSLPLSVLTRPKSKPSSERALRLAEARENRVDEGELWLGWAENTGVSTPVKKLID